MTTLESKIHEVTVYPDRAEMIRTATVELTEGTHKLMFDFLPLKIDSDSIQVNGKGNAILHDVKFQKKHYEVTPDETIQKKIEQYEELEREIAVQKAIIDNATAELDFVYSIIKRITQPPEKQSESELEPEKWEKMTSFYRLKLDELDKEIKKAGQDKALIDKKLNKVGREIDDAKSSKEKTKNQVVATVDVKSAGTVYLELTYIVKGCGWKPLYDVRVNSAKKETAITYYAMVTQNTAEDWDDIGLSLSTAQPKISGTEPKLKPWRIDIFRPSYAEEELVQRDFARKTDSLKKKRPPMVGAMPELLDSMVAPETEVETKATSVVFTVSGKSTVKSDNKPHKATILIKKFPSEFQYNTIPKLNPYSYLKAKIKNTSDYPFLAGKSNIFLDNSFVAKANFNLVAPGEEFWTSLGVDEGIHVEHKFIKKYEKDEGVFTKKTKLIFEFLLIVTNKKKTEEKIVLKDQIPIAQHKDITVELIEPKYEKDTETLKMDNLKRLEWTLNAKPGEKIEIPFKYSVDYPRDEIIDGMDF